jgi:hypothetical protein
MRRNAQSLAANCGLDINELLHTPIDRALPPGTSRPDDLLTFCLPMLMRSNVSSCLRLIAPLSARM